MSAEIGSRVYLFIAECSTVRSNTQEPLHILDVSSGELTQLSIPLRSLGWV